MLNEEDVYNSRRSQSQFKFEFLKMSKYGDVQSLLGLDSVYRLVRDEYMRKRESQPESQNQAAYLGDLDDEAMGCQNTGKSLPVSLVAFVLA